MISHWSFCSFNIVSMSGGSIVIAWCHGGYNIVTIEAEMSLELMECSVDPSEVKGLICS